MSGVGWILVLISSALALLTNLLLWIGVDRADGLGQVCPQFFLILASLCKPSPPPSSLVLAKYYDRC